MGKEATQRNIRHLEAYNEGDLDAISETCFRDFVFHEPSRPDTVGVEAYRDLIRALRESFPDLQLTIDEEIDAGEYVIIRWTLVGTHAAASSVIPIPGTGREVCITGCAIDRLVNGKFAETWNYPELLGLMQQVGAIPAMA
jgi:steroid delta-isomerase-like uncharacterized protein